MNCSDARQLLQPYSDGELELARHVEIDEHLAACAACDEQEKNLRSLRTAISSRSLCYSAPAALRARIQYPTHSFNDARRRSALRLVASAAAVLLMIATSATIGMRWSRSRISDDDRLAELVVAGHVRALQVDHLADVASSDRHTVKPWFQGKLAFAPQVPDLSPQGYVLSGGRLDYLTDRPVAAIVYYRRSHVINVFTWPADDDHEKGVRGLSAQGFHMRNWQQSGMTYWAVSDLNDEELDQFVRLFQESPAKPHP